MEFWIEKEDPEAAIGRFLRVTSLSTNKRIYNLIVDTSAGPNHFRSSFDGAEVNAVLKNEELSLVIQWLKSKPHAQLKAVATTVNLTGHHISVRLDREAHHDKISIKPSNNNNVPPPVMSALMDLVCGEYKAIPAEEALRTVETQTLKLEQNLLTQLIHRLSESTTLLHRALADESKTLLEQITVTAQKLRDETEQERTKLRTAYESEAAKLKQEWEAFEEEKKKWNDQKSTLVRRDLLDQIRNQLKEHGKTFKLSEDTYKKAQPIRSTCYFLVTISLLGIIGFGVAVFIDEAIKLHHLLPLSTSFAVLVSTAIYYIKWQNGWLARHADLETRNQILDYDILRASWFAEMLFEYREHEGQPLPESVIQVMTRNLFDSPNDQTSISHPAEDMAAFLKRLNRVRVGNSEVELEAKSTTKNP